MTSRTIVSATRRAAASTLVVTALAAAMFATPRAASAQSRFLHQPDVSASHIAFVHANDIWVVGRDGGNATRLTSSEGAETEPHFSPDGESIAFSGQYGGNTDVVARPPGGSR